MSLKSSSYNITYIGKVCQTLFGKFKVKVDNKNISVGGRAFCVNLTLRENETVLYWLKTDEGGCELGKHSGDLLIS